MKKTQKNKYKNNKTKKLDKIFNKKKSKILFTKYYGLHKKKENKKVPPNSVIQNIKDDFKESPSNYLPIENLFNSKNMNKLDFNPNPYIKTQIDKNDKKYRKRLDYINNELNRKFKDIIKTNKTKVKNLYDQFLSRDYDYKKELFDSSEDYNIYKIQEKYSNYPKLVFETNCGKQITFFDFNKIAEKYDYFDIGYFELYNKMLIFSVDLYGNGLYHIFIKKMYENKINEINVKHNKGIKIQTHTFYDVISSNSNGNFVCLYNYIYFVATTKDLSYNKLYRYDIEKKKNKIIYSNNDPHYFIHIFCLKNELFMNISRYDGNSLHIYNVNNNKFNTILPFKKDFTYEIDIFNNNYYILERFKSSNKIYRTNDFKNKELLHKSSNKEDIYNNLSVLNDKYLITTCKNYENVFLMCTNLCDKNTQKIHIIDTLINKNTDVKLYSIKYIFTQNTQYSNDFYVEIKSFLFPSKTLYVNLDKKLMHVLEDSPKNSNMLLHSYYKKNYESIIKNKIDSENYKSKLLFIPNTPKVAVYLIYKKDLKLDGKNKCLLKGYGAYGSDITSNYLSKNGGLMYYKSLLDEDFVIAIAYIRGGQFGGFKFHKEGRNQYRKNVYNDFIKVAKYLINQNITESQRLAIYGRSAGGLLVGNVINMEPELCKLAILGVPFVMPYHAMLDKTNPLAYESHFEFGNPYDKKEREEIKKYSPYLQVDKEKEYPNIYIFSNLYDSKTPYNEGYSYYHKLKECDVFKNNKKDLIYYLNNKYGHHQASKHLENKYEMACFFTIIMNYIK